MQGETVRRLDGRVAVVTGGAGGIGRATVRRMASEGAKLVVADLDADTGAATAGEVGGLFIRVDVTDKSEVEGLFRAAYEAHGRIDVAFNNAGISPPEDDSILTTDLAAWHRVQDVNLTSVYLCCQAVIPYMQRAGKGSIINTASFVALVGSATSQISYTASKGGVLALSRELGVQFAREGIRRECPVPGAREHADVARVVRQGPRAGGEADGSYSSWTFRRTRGNSFGGDVLGQ